MFFPRLGSRLGRTIPTELFRIWKQNVAGQSRLFLRCDVRLSSGMMVADTILLNCLVGREPGSLPNANTGLVPPVAAEADLTTKLEHELNLFSDRNIEMINRRTGYRHARWRADGKRVVDWADTHGSFPSFPSFQRSKELVKAPHHDAVFTGKDKLCRLKRHHTNRLRRR